MALQITGNIQTDTGLSFSSLYGRTTYLVDDKSDKVKINVLYWQSEEDYTSGKFDLGGLLDINIQKTFPYNRETDGSDVLSFTQNVIKEQLEGLGLSVVISEL